MAKAKANDSKQSGPATINNRRAWFDYEILDSLEAGIALVGSEVKSLFLGRANLTDAFCKVTNGEIWLVAMEIEPYEKASLFIPERRRDRKLLLHKREIEVLKRKSQEKGLTIIPLKVYFKNGRAKVQIGLARGKKQYDKREAIAEKDTRREMERAKNIRL